MAYNKAREEKQWLLWKEAEEKELRRLGMDEDTIQQIRAADWENFKSERRYQERRADIESYIDRLSTKEHTHLGYSVQELLDEIEDEELYRILMLVDKLTLQILIWRMEGYTSAEISKKSGLSVSAVDVRIWRLKEKIKIFSGK